MGVYCIRMYTTEKKWYNGTENLPVKIRAKSRARVTARKTAVFALEAKVLYVTVCRKFRAKINVPVDISQPAGFCFQVFRNLPNVAFQVRSFFMVDHNSRPMSAWGFFQLLYNWCELTSVLSNDGMTVSPILEGEYWVVYVPALSLLAGKLYSSRQESRSKDMFAENINKIEEVF